MVADVDTVVLTHMHGDHLDGAVHIRRPVLVHDSELRFSRTRGARMMQAGAPPAHPGSQDPCTVAS